MNGAGMCGLAELTNHQQPVPAESAIRFIGTRNDREMNKTITRYWLAHYANGISGLCSLCGNSGEIDTRGTAISGAGINAGRVNFCICPNGQTMRSQIAPTKTDTETRPRR